VTTLSASEKQCPTIEVRVTAGNLRNGHVYIKDCLWFFPKEAIRGERTDQTEAHPCTLELAEVGVVETEIDPHKGIFRWRGWKKFFLQHNVVENDSIVFSRINRYRFAVEVRHNVLEGLQGSLAGPLTEKPKALRMRSAKRCNDLSGDEWLRNSVSIWSDIRKTQEEQALNHPAMFPTMLCERLILTFLRRRGKHRILDPFMGSGSTLVAARTLGKVGIGLEINAEYISMAKARLDAPTLFQDGAPEYEIHQADAQKVPDHVKPDSIDLCITSPPYWDILNQKRTADGKEIRNYGNLSQDLGTIPDYEQFLDALAGVFAGVLGAMKPAAYCIVVVMDLRKKNRFYPFHSDLASRLTRIGFVWDDTIIWDRGREYNNLRPLGYPSVFRVNKVHEFILIFKKPQE